MQLRLLCTFALYRLEPYWTKGTCGLRGFVAKFKTLKNMVYHAMHDTSIFHPPAIPLRKWYIWQCDVFLWICDHCDACIIKIYNSLATAYLRKEGWWEAHVAREWRWIRWWHEGQYCSLQSCCPLTYHCSWISNGYHKKSKLLYRTLTIILPSFHLSPAVLPSNWGSLALQPSGLWPLFTWACSFSWRCAQRAYWVRAWLVISFAVGRSGMVYQSIILIVWFLYLKTFHCFLVPHLNSIDHAI